MWLNLNIVLCSDHGIFCDIITVVITLLVIHTYKQIYIVPISWKRIRGAYCIINKSHCFQTPNVKILSTNEMHRS